MRKVLLGLAFLFTACGDAPPAKPPAPEPEVTGPSEPETLELTDVEGAETPEQSLGKPVIRLPDGTLVVRAGRGHVGIVVRWIARKHVVVQLPAK